VEREVSQASVEPPQSALDEHAPPVLPELLPLELVVLLAVVVPLLVLLLLAPEVVVPLLLDDELAVLDDADDDAVEPLLPVLAPAPGLNEVELPLQLATTSRHTQPHARRGAMSTLRSRKLRREV
jgi:hypothetical protein